MTISSNSAVLLTVRGTLVLETLEAARNLHNETHMTGLGAAFAGPPQATVWEQADGKWSEW